MVLFRKKILYKILENLDKHIIHFSLLLFLFFKYILQYILKNFK